MIYFILAKLIAAVDLWFKEIIEEIPHHQFPRTLKNSKGRIVLHRKENDGLPYGTLSKNPHLTKMLPSAMLVVVVLRLCALVCKKSDKTIGTRMHKLGLSFVIGGGLSNVADRFRKGYVVDYFSFNIPKCKKLQDTVFNLGDIFILIGFMLTLIFQVGKDNR